MAALLVEIQALLGRCACTESGNARRSGLEQNWLAMLLAVLYRHAGIACSDQDGPSTRSAGQDRRAWRRSGGACWQLPCHYNRALPKNWWYSELGLTGEVRPAARPGAPERAAKPALSAPSCLANQPKQAIDGIDRIAVERLEQALDRCWEQAMLAIQNEMIFGISIHEQKYIGIHRLGCYPPVRGAQAGVFAHACRRQDCVPGSAPVPRTKAAR